jgi:hypothetical protein
MGGRTAIIEKIKALLAKTVERGASEHEMMAALGKAAAMMDAYDISDEEVDTTREEAAMLHADPPDLSDPHKIKWRLSHGVSKFCDVQIYRSRRETGLKCIGMPSDVQFAMWLLDSLAEFVFRELYTHLLGCLAPKNERRVIISSFTAACCEHITARLVELAERSKAAAARTTNGRELVIVKDAAVKAFMKAQGIHIHICGGPSPSNVNASAQAAGRAAGGRAAFGRPVSGSAGALRIGRS